MYIPKFIYNSKSDRKAFNGNTRETKPSQSSLNTKTQERKNGTKLNPLQLIEEFATGITIASKPSFENTRGRYPWICSLRGRQDKKHYCGATVLSRPPGPLVIVTAAHCVQVCRTDDERTVNNCCCENVSGAGCHPDSDIDCGTNQTVGVMTGEDAEVICGEWETGDDSDTTEEYNIILEIRTIRIHPDYFISQGVNNSQYVINDIATIHVAEEPLTSQDVSRLTPACLPEAHSSSFAVHAGWSSPPPLKYVQEEFPVFEDYYQDFMKMFHYNMTLMTCQDPGQYFNQNGPTGVKVTYPTNSYYPPGTVCAREKNLEFCPTSGESGSPLMVRNKEGKFSAIGVNSFIKGCSTFTITIDDVLERDEDKARNKTVTLGQYAENPTVYTKLECFLPWVATQYNMSYTHPAGLQPECDKGVGDINETSTRVCRTSPTDEIDRFYKEESECIFPFTLDNVTYNQCALSQIKDFTRPQFVCPIRTTKSRGRNFQTRDMDVSFCPTNFLEGGFSLDGPVFAPNNNWELDPDVSRCPYGIRKVLFATCKNTCPGGRKVSRYLRMTREPYKRLFFLLNLI